MQEKDDKPKRGRKPVAAPAPTAKADTAASKPARKPIAKKSAEPIEEPKRKTAAPIKIQKDHSEDDKASKIAAALFGDESAASQAHYLKVLSGPHGAAFLPFRLEMGVAPRATAHRPRWSSCAAPVRAG